MSPLADPLRIDQVTVDFGGLRALDDVSLVVGEQTVTGLIGPNGAGKTTLFDCVSGLVEPSSGRIELFGEDMIGRPLHERARLGLGRTFQRLELFGSLTVDENLVVALEADSSVGGLVSEVLRRPASLDVRHRAHGRAQELLELVGLTEHARARTADLPMGLARRLEVARALATEPKLLLLDEPSSGLNDTESSQLADLLRTVQRERDLSMLVVEHDMEFVLGLCDNAYVLDFGKMLASGTPDELRADARVRAAYLGEEVSEPA